MALFFAKALRISIAGLITFISACATAPEQTSWRAERHAAQSGYYGPEIDQIARAALADRNPEAHYISFDRTKVGRAAIASDGFPKAAAHEQGISPHAGSDNRILSQIAPQISNTQNGVIDNGWRQTSEGYFHHLSGLKCPGELRLDLEEEGKEKRTAVIPIVDIRLFAQDGSDTACDYHDAAEKVYITIFVSKWPDVALADHFSAALKHIVDRFPVESEQEVIDINMVLEDVDHTSTIEGKTLVGAYLLKPNETDGSRQKTALWLNKTGGWHVKMRGTYGVSMKDGEVQLAPGEVLAAAVHAISLYEVDAHINSEQAVEVSF